MPNSIAGSEVSTEGAQSAGPVIDSNFWDKLKVVITDVGKVQNIEQEKRLMEFVSGRIDGLRNEFRGDLAALCKRLDDLEFGDVPMGAPPGVVDAGPSRGQAVAGAGMAPVRQQWPAERVQSQKRARSTPAAQPAAQGPAESSTDDCRVWILGFPRKLLKEDFEKVEKTIGDKYLTEQIKQTTKFLHFNLRINMSLVLPCREAVESLLERTMAEPIMWHDARSGEVIKLRLRRDKPIRDRQLGRVMGQVWKAASVALGSKIEKGHLGTARGALFYREDKELFEFCEIIIDYASDSLVLLKFRADDWVCTKFGISAQDAKRWCKDACDIEGVSWF
jgi:hypothetical protein